ncbi:MAG: 4-alpha-glucanotransferase [Thiobacillus sp.]|nr:4-alpha-glucanotransferase [Thiobacillus sp.]
MALDFDQLCTQAGILPDYYDIWGSRHEAGEATRQAILEAMQYDGDAIDLLPPVVVTWEDQAVDIPVSDGKPVDWRLVLEDEQVMKGADGVTRIEFPAVGLPGYHNLLVSRAGSVLARVPLIVCPRSSFQPDAARRKWGLSVQLYGVRTGADWGLGDYTDLAGVIDWAAGAGAGMVGLNPLHALFPHNPGHCSPYSPSSRQFLNVLHIGIAELPEYAECPEAQAQVAEPAFQARLAALRQADLVDYTGVAELKFAVLETLYRHFRSCHLAPLTSYGSDFRAFQARGGEELHQFALYHALQEYFHRQDRTYWGWPAWPAAYRRHDSAEVQAFAADNMERVEWQQWLQWHADRQLASAARLCDVRGMAIGLYQDLAVGVDKGGAETWVHQELYALEARVGCPPDDFNPRGQDWGLPPWIPQRLRAAAYAPYIAMLRANMRYAGALRVDHVMGLMRLYWIPPGMKGDAGAYVAYPFQDLLGILNLESQRNRCLIVGEDLGTVPDEVRHALREAGVLSYKLFYFERQPDGHFFPADWFPEQSLVAASTHDLPTLAGFWLGRDIATRTELDLYPRPEMREQQIAARVEDRVRLIADLAREGLLPEGVSGNPEEMPELTPALIRAIHAHLARSQARLALVQAEDMLGQTEQANQPGTVAEHPNWRRKLTLAVADWPGDGRCQAMAATMAAERPTIG